jgi:hypothetical protein
MTARISCASRVAEVCSASLVQLRPSAYAVSHLLHHGESDLYLDYLGECTGAALKASAYENSWLPCMPNERLRSRLSDVTNSSTINSANETRTIQKLIKAVYETCSPMYAFGK